MLLILKTILQEESEEELPNVVSEGQDRFEIPSTGKGSSSLSSRQLDTASDSHLLGTGSVKSNISRDKDN